MNPIKDINIDFSKRDLIRKVTIPKEITPELAEIIGVIIGDGHIDQKKYKRTKMNQLSIAGNYSEDYDYYLNEINPIFSKLFNLKLKISSRRNNELNSVIYSKGIVRFFELLGIKSGRKVDDIGIPEIILNSEDEIKRSFLRGLFDTESSISFKKYKGKHIKPVIATRMKSYKIIVQIREILDSLGFRVGVYKDDYLDKRTGKLSLGYKLQIPGKKNLEKFKKFIGFRNSRHITKLKIWEKYGFCPPRLDYCQRKLILEGRLDPNSFYSL